MDTVTLVASDGGMIEFPRSIIEDASLLNTLSEHGFDVEGFPVPVAETSELEWFQNAYDAWKQQQEPPAAEVNLTNLVRYHGLVVWLGMDDSWLLVIEDMINRYLLNNKGIPLADAVDSLSHIVPNSRRRIVENIPPAVESEISVEGYIKAWNCDLSLLLYSLRGDIMLWNSRTQRATKLEPDTYKNYFIIDGDTPRVGVRGFTSISSGKKVISRGNGKPVDCGRQIFFEPPNAELRDWDGNVKRLRPALEGWGSKKIADVSPQARYYITKYQWNSAILISDVATGKLLSTHQLKIKPTEYSGLTFLWSPTDRFLVCYSLSDYQACVIDPETGQEYYFQRPPDSTVEAVTDNYLILRHGYYLGRRQRDLIILPIEIVTSRSQYDQQKYTYVVPPGFDKVVAGMDDKFLLTYPRGSLQGLSGTVYRIKRSDLATALLEKL